MRAANIQKELVRRCTNQDNEVLQFANLLPIVERFSMNGSPTKGVK